MRVGMSQVEMMQGHKEEVRQFLALLFGDPPKGFIEIRAIDGTGYLERGFYSDLDSLIDDLTNPTRFAEKDIYFGVGLRTRERGRKEDVGEISCLWADVDARDKDTTLNRVSQFKLSPSIIVDSGHGFHLYWLLDKPYPTLDESNRRTAEGLNKGLAEKLGGDSAFDLARILRVPHTENLKNPRNPLPVLIAKIDRNLRYNLKEFREFWVDPGESTSSTKKKIKRRDVPNRFWPILQKNKRVKATWEGKRPDLSDQTHSGYDMALANLLMKHNFDDSEVAAILRASPSGKGKDAKPQYLALTIGKARTEWKKQNKRTAEVKKDSSGNKQMTKLKEEIRTLIPNLIHLVREDGIVKYLLKKEDKLHIQEKFISDGVTYRPKQDLPIKIPGPDILEESMGIDYKALLDEVIRLIKSYLEMPLECNYLVLALWIFHTYLIEKFNATPILYFYGVKETGKSRAGEILGELAFRCERLTSPTEATLFRGADYFRTSLVIDEIKLWGPKGNQDVARLIKSRYKRGLKVPRVNLNKKGEDQIEYFDVFAPLVICTTESIPDTIESRCITFLMQKNVAVEVEKLIDEEWANKLRNRLTIFRARYLDEDLPKSEQVARRRLNEIVMPLYQILMLIAPEREGEFKKTIRQMEKAKEKEEGLSLEAEIVEQIANYQKENGDAPFLTNEIVERLNETRHEKERLSSMLVSTRIRRLGFEKTRLANGKRGFTASSELLARLALQFGIDL